MLGYHVILGMYGFWLPNDPRGSWSDFVWSEDLVKHGPATKVSTRHSVAHTSHDVKQRLAAKQSLHYPPVQLNGLQALAVSTGVSKSAGRFGFPVWACAILPEHTHLVLGLGSEPVERMIAYLKQSATWKLRQEGRHPLIAHRTKDDRTPSPWGRGHWKVFLNDARHVQTAIRYVERNPLKDGMPKQTWSFVEGSPHT